MFNQNLQERKNIILQEYKKALDEYNRNRSQENWIKYCDAKNKCMMMGIII